MHLELKAFKPEGVKNRGVPFTEQYSKKEVLHFGNPDSILPEISKAMCIQYGIYK